MNYDTKMLNDREWYEYFKGNEIKGLFSTKRKNYHQHHGNRANDDDSSDDEQIVAGKKRKRKRFNSGQSNQSKPRPN